MEVMSLLGRLRSSDKIVLADKHFQLTGSEFVDKVMETSEILAQYHVGKGTPVLVTLNNDVPSVVALFASWYRQAMVFIGNPFSPVESYAELIGNYRIHTVIAGKPAIKALQIELANSSASVNYALNTLSALSIPEHLHAIAEVDLRLEAAAVAIFSSGSTGKPKAILHSFASVYQNASAHAQAIGLKDTDTVGCVLPIFYSYGLVANLLSALITGARVVLQQAKSGLDDSWISAQGISVIALTPFFARDIQITSPSLRVMTLGGDALDMDTARKIRSAHPNCELYSTYGLTEAGPRVATWRFDNCDLPQHNIAPLGEPLACNSFELLGLDENHGQGELVVETRTRMLGYYYGFNQGIEIPDWGINKVYTGDLFQMIDGQYYFVGRSKDLIVQNGEKIYPALIESLLLRLENIIDARVIGAQDSIKGQIAEAYIHASCHLDIHNIERFLLAHLPRSAIPAKYYLVEKINRTVTGKKTNNALFVNDLKNSFLLA